MAAKTRYVGFREEDPTNYGGLVADTTYDFDVASMGLDAPDDPNIVLPTLNRFQTRHMPGFYSPSGPMEYAMDINTIGYFLKFALGGYEFTEGALETDENIHEFWATPGYTLPSFNARVGKDTFEHIFLGCVIDKLGLSIENELATIKADMLAQRDQQGALRETLNDPDPDLYPLAFYNSKVELGGTDVSQDVRKFTWDYANGIKAEEGQGLGSRFPYYMKGRAGSCDVGLKLYDDSVDLLQDFWGNDTGPADSVIAGEAGVDTQTPFSLESYFESGDFGNMTMEFASCYYKKVPTDISGGDPRIPDLTIGTEASMVTLNDAVTEVFTPVYIKLLNFEPEIKYTAPPP